MESQPKNPEFMINPENFHPRIMSIYVLISLSSIPMNSST